MKKVTAGKDLLGDFAPKFGELNDEVLFGAGMGQGGTAFSEGKKPHYRFRIDGKRYFG